MQIHCIVLYVYIYVCTYIQLSTYGLSSSCFFTILTHTNRSRRHKKMNLLLSMATRWLSMKRWYHCHILVFSMYIHIYISTYIFVVCVKRMAIGANYWNASGARRECNIFCTLLNLMSESNYNNCNTHCVCNCVHHFVNSCCCGLMVRLGVRTTGKAVWSFLNYQIQPHSENTQPTRGDLN